MANLGKLQRQVRSEGNKAVFALERYAPYVVKQAFVQGNYDVALAALAESIRLREPWALRAWLEAAGVVGAMSQVVVQVHQSLGVRDERELAELVESGRRMEQLKADASTSLEEYANEAAEMLLQVFRERPELREGVMMKLNGTQSAESKPMPNADFYDGTIDR